MNEKWCRKPKYMNRRVYVHLKKSGYQNYPKTGKEY